MKVLVVNAGSSSLKLKVVDLDTGREYGSGMVERIGGQARWVGVRTFDADVATMRDALRLGVEELIAAGAMSTFSELGAIGHRVVHGGERFSGAVLLTPDVIAGIESVSDLAPLHNPANLEGIRVAQALAPDLPNVGVFDTAFHQTMPEYAARFAVPEAWYREHGVRRYGFHGTSHQFVSRRADELAKLRGQGRVVVLHLGNGASGAAVLAGKSVHTTMGMTPLDGLVMGTRTGELDAAVPLYLLGKTDMSLEEMEHALQKESGLRGLCGDSDMREVCRRADEGDSSAQLALDVFCFRARCAVASLAAAMGGIDCLAFTGGIGEHAAQVREQICEQLGFLGVELGEPRKHGDETALHAGTVQVWVIPTDEEWEIATQTAAVVRAEVSSHR